MSEDIQEEAREETEKGSRPRIGRRDLLAGFVLGVESIPDAMASAILAGVNPIHGLYAVMLSTPIGALFASSVFMSVQTTSALSLIVFDVAEVHQGEEGIMALFTLAILTGVFMLIFGLLKLGSLLRFVPHAVMTGFINGIAVLIILGQLGEFTGYDSLESNKVMQTIDLIFNFREIQLQTLAVGVVTILLILFINNTRLKQFSFIIALILASALVPLFDWSGVLQVADVSTLPSTLPRPVIPDLSFIPALIIPAISIAIVGLVQGAGISQSYPNPDGKYPDASGDFVGQGAANIAAGFFRGMPVGGSLSATSLVVSSGARSRMANIAAGVVIAVAVIIFGRFIEALAMPALAGLLILIGFQTLQPREIEKVWKTGTLQQLTMTATFVGSLIMPLQFAVFLGVVLSLFLFVVDQSNQLKVFSWEIKEGEYPVEKPAPDELLPEEVVVLVPAGSLFFAAAPIFEEELPELDKAHRSVVIISLRGYETVGSTFLTVLEKFHTAMVEHDSKLILAELSDDLWGQLAHTGHIQLFGRDQVYEATDRVAESIYIAYADAQKWVNE
jgi:SulP family sulfate permease